MVLRRSFQAFWVSGNWMASIGIATRSITAAVLRPTTKSVDAALLLAPAR